MSQEIRLMRKRLVVMNSAPLLTTEKQKPDYRFVAFCFANPAFVNTIDGYVPEGILSKCQLPKESVTVEYEVPSTVT